MKILIFFLSLAVMVPASHAETSADQKFTAQVSDILMECSKLKPGTTRSELLKIFMTEGGPYNAGGRTFVFKRCPYIKIDVTFALTQPNQIAELPTDTIKSISKPFLEWSDID